MLCDFIAAALLLLYGCGPKLFNDLTNENFVFQLFLFNFIISTNTTNPKLTEMNSTQFGITHTYTHKCIHLHVTPCWILFVSDNVLLIFLCARHFNYFVFISLSLSFFSFPTPNILFILIFIFLLFLYIVFICLHFVSYFVIFLYFLIFLFHFILFVLFHLISLTTLSLSASLTH